MAMWWKRRENKCASVPNRLTTVPVWTPVRSTVSTGSRKLAQAAFVVVVTSVLPSIAPSDVSTVT